MPDYKLMTDYLDELSNIVLEINKAQQEAEEKARQKARDELLKLEIKKDKNIYQGNRTKLIIFGVDFEKGSLFYKDNCIVENYKIFLDIYTPQLSTFNAYNYYNLNVEIEDIVCILNNENQLYIGIITHIEKTKMKIYIPLLLKILNLFLILKFTTYIKIKVDIFFYFNKNYL
ncbi:hypothetical protein [Spiroplasma citri]|nr:hypothetical protein [Spiroplasma citri]APE75394.1 hypothetical protein SCITRI_001519 [Spiroplasma citri]QED25266.1 hypothetical protein FRX96_07960 [Spiroplasma citri]QIA67608.1 hypothetical protein GMI18_08325 [Spiroplasma citri]QIA71322.1 hypothetical protein GL981_08280 [Spiroplasma citri]QIA73456.1 hypothetical protein GL982_07555 [Spiroplasma citri]